MDHCPNPLCNNKTPLPSRWPNEYYTKHTRLLNGGQRYKCKFCGKTFTRHAKEPSSSQLLDKSIYRLLISGRTVKQIRMELDTTAEYIYKRLDVLCNKAQIFENELLIKSTVIPDHYFKCSIIENRRIFILIDPSSGYIFEATLGENYSHEKHGKDIEKIEVNEKIVKFIELAKKKLYFLRVALRVPIVVDREVTNQALNLFRIHYNFKVRMDTKTTPAMALGAETEIIDIADILIRNP